MILECSGYTHSPRPVESIGDKVYIVNNLLVESDVNSQMLHRNGPGPVGVVLQDWSNIGFWITVMIISLSRYLNRETMYSNVLWLE